MAVTHMVTQPSQADYARADAHDAVNTCIRAWPHAQDDAATIGYPKSASLDGRGGGRVVKVRVIDRSDPDYDRDVAVPVTSVEGVAFNLVEHPDPATAWLAELYDIANLFITNQAGMWWARHAATEARTGGYQIIKQAWHDGVDIHMNSWPKDLHKWVGLCRLANRAKVNWPVMAKKGQIIDGVTVGERGNNATLCALCGAPIGGGRQDPLRTITTPLGEVRSYHLSPCWYAYTMDRGERPPYVPKHAQQIHLTQDHPPDRFS